MKGNKANDNQAYEEIVPWLQLNSLGPLRRRNFKELYAEFEDPRRILSAIGKAGDSKREDLRVSSRVLKGLEEFDPAAEWAECTRLGAELISFDSARYPALLRELHNPPPLLYYRGDPPALGGPALAVVGTRVPTEYGRKMARSLGRDLAARGVTVVSGGARGIDTAAHEGALEAPGRTLAILGSDIATVYPPENRKLFERIVAGGGLVSEFPLGTHPGKYTFPLRNRIITGMSLGVVVVEAPKGSGALLSAEAALDQNREVFAVPGRATHPASWGPHDLIRRGAKLVETVEDILEEFDFVTTADSIPLPVNAAAAEKDGREIMALLSYDPLHVDELARLTGRSAAEITGVLFELEIEGLIRRVDGMRYVLT